MGELERTDTERLVRALEQDLREDLQDISARLKLKDEVIASLTESNKSLGEQLRQRWTFPQVFVQLLGFLFTIMFAYQMFKADDIRQTSDRFAAMLNDLHTVKSQTTAGTKAQAMTIAALTRASGQLATGYRLIVTQRQTAASLEAEKAIGLLQQAWDNINKLEDRPASGHGDVRPLDDFAAIDLVYPLTEAVKDALFSAHSLSALAKFQMGEAEVLGVAADRMIELDSTRYEGYHFRALAKLHSGGEPDAIIEDLNKSLALSGGPNIDRINLAEIYLMKGDGANATAQAVAYLKSDPSAGDGTELKVVCDFLKLAGRYVTDEASENDIAKAVESPPPPLTGYSVKSLLSWEAKGFKNLSSEKHSGMSSLIHWLGDKKTLQSVAQKRKQAAL